MKKFGNVLWGIVLIIIGLIIGGNALRITNINIFFFFFFMLFIIVPCFIGIFKEDENSYYCGGLILTKIVKEWLSNFNSIEECVKELQAQGGVKIALEETKTKDGKNNLTTVKVM